MSVLVPQVDGIPAPAPSPSAEPYWDGCRHHELRFLRCADCGARPPLPTPVCPRCRSGAVSWEPSAGRGALYSWTVVWRPQDPAFSVPYAPAVVTMDEGFNVLAAMVGCEPEALCDGLAVEVEFHRVSDEITLPFFHPR